MLRVFQIGVLCIVLLLQAGCESAAEQDEKWKDLTLADVAPSGGGWQDQMLKMINLNIYSFELPAEKIGRLSEIWGLLYRSPVRFKDAEAFEANMLSVVFGQGRQFGRVLELLESYGVGRARRVSLLLVDGQSNELSVSRLGRERTIFYASRGSVAEGVDVGPGILGLRLLAEKVPGLKGQCNVRATPVFMPVVRGSIRPLAARVKSNEFRFSSAGFWLRMSVGDFFVLGPRDYGEGQIRLADYLFSQPTPSSGVRLYVDRSLGAGGRPERYFGPVVRLYVVICSGINY
jgi:hypothetical protein